MAITNLTRAGKQAETFEDLLCSVDWVGGIHEQNIYLSGLNIFLSITAFLGNALILVALHKESSLHPPSKVLLRCLATTDLLLKSVVKHDWNICRSSSVASFIAGYILSSVSLLTLTAISVDRLLALLLRLRYRHVVTLKRTCVLVAIFWVVSILAGASYFLNYLITFWFGNIVISLSLITSVFSYTKIFNILRQHQGQVHPISFSQDQPSDSIPLNIPRYRKAVSTALWVQLTLVLCYLPYGIAGALFSNKSSPSPWDFVAWECAIAIVYLNSSLNPFLYCWKIREVRQAVKETVRQILCCSCS
ncbi:adenosine receptor A2a-like [Oculina patagonica]